MNLRSISYIVYIFSVLYLTAYVERIAPMDLKDSWQKHPVLLGFTIVFFIGFLVFAYFQFKLRRTESYKQESNKSIKKVVEEGRNRYLAINGTIGTIFFPLVMIVLEYIKNPSIDFPYHKLLLGFIGYPLAYILWIFNRKQYDNLVKPNNEQ